MGTWEGEHGNNYVLPQVRLAHPYQAKYLEGGVHREGFRVLSTEKQEGSRPSRYSQHLSPRRT